MHLSTKELILCALFIALITVGTFIKIPVGTDVYTLRFLLVLSIVLRKFLQTS